MDNEYEWNDRLWDKVSKEMIDLLNEINFKSRQEFIDAAEELALDLEVLRYFDDKQFPEFFAERLCEIPNLLETVATQTRLLRDEQCMIAEALEIIFNKED